MGIISSLVGVVTFFLGFIIFSFTVGNILLISFFAIPFTKKLEKVPLLKNNTIISSYIIAATIQVIVLSATTIIFCIYLQGGPVIGLMLGYLFGMVATITKRKEFGINLNNFSDYFKTNERYFFEEFINLTHKDADKSFRFVIALMDENNRNNKNA